MGLVLCFSPSTNHEHEEIAVVKAISNSPGNFWINDIFHVLPIDNQIKIYIRNEDVVRLPNMIWTVLFPLILNIVKKQKTKESLVLI